MNQYSEEEALGKVYDARLTRRLLGYLAPYRKVVVLSVILLLLVSGLQLVGPFLTKIAIDNYIKNGDMGGLARIAGIFLLVLLAQFLLAFLQTYLMNWTGQRIMYDSAG